eukprot:gnl/TRDRNA2_/TRDRNA2_188660_c0_seq1.p1 gnl/TRDRNA2_/TRDRNA2_188660_c0~~gnl/TRDRNA2_/TRDRNA2_188660_c0_seq1.p1  ORF type:complete len:164 (-),score=41.12 gnl/TRDRNA2_/TRDRNA2_188660_c0_seq1:78-569(-)
MARSMSDLRKRDEEERDDKNTESYAGGHKSGLALEHPGDGQPQAQAQVGASASAGNSFSGGSSAAPAEPAAPPVSAGAGDAKVDDSKPKCKIQIRFHDGSKKAQEFNQDQTVGHLRAYCGECIGVPAAGVTILGGFPPKELTDDAATLKDAGLGGGAVTVRPK